MDDLAGLDMSSSNNTSSKPGMSNSSTSTGANYYPTIPLRPTPPLSRNSTPVQQNGNGSSTPSSVTGHDSFADLLPFHSSGPKSNVTLTLQERQKKILREQQKSKSEGTGFEGLGSPASAILPPKTRAVSNERSVSSPLRAEAARNVSTASAPTGPSAFGATGKFTTTESEADLLAAFSSDAPVNRATNFPTLSNKSSGSSGVTTVQPQKDTFSTEDNDDDPFGLGTAPFTLSSSATAASSTALVNEDDDDVLGLLGKPVSELPPRIPTESPPTTSPPVEPLDKAIAELVDMGFPQEASTEALMATGPGLDVQAAVGYLLNKAHSDSRSKSQPSRSGASRSSSRSHREQERSGGEAPVPAWARRESSAGAGMGRNSSPAAGEKDAAKVAAEIGSSFLKTANSIWKTGTKKFNRAVADFNADNGDPNMPRWMRESQGRLQDQLSPESPEAAFSERSPDQSRPMQSSSKPLSQKMTDEAMLLESENARPGRQKPQSSVSTMKLQAQEFGSASKPRFSKQQSWQEGTSTVATPPLRQKHTKQMVEEESAQAYVSPARRKKPTPKNPEEPDTLLDITRNREVVQEKSGIPTGQSRQKPTSAQPSKPSAPLPTRPQAPKRTIPPVSSIAIQSSTTHRQAGADAFKLGNYAAATDAYTSALRDIPSNHPLTIVILTNRSLTHLKTGDPKASIADAETAMTTIGSARGDHETIDLGGSEGTKPMGTFWGRAMMRKAEALEQLEKWPEAAVTWSECVQAGVGGATSVRGRDRCEKATGNSRPAARSSTRSAPPASVSARKPIVRPPPSSRPAVSTSTSAEAVSRLRAANAQADAVDNEKFALADIVDERLTRWRSGKEGNLRALLGSLETVLWEDAGWKKVGMSELIVPTRVKLVYMKGIAKVHPDKLPRTATTEQVMISGAVFSTLNEAWDRFKKENSL